MTYARKQSIISYDYLMDTSTMPRVNTFKDLGVFFTSKLSFSDHIDMLIHKAYKKPGFIIRNTFNFSNPLALQYLFNSFVRSKLEYCAVVWNPHYEYQKSGLEMIQKKFLILLLPSAWISI